MTAADDFEDDAFEGACLVCGYKGVFQRQHRSLREGYTCPDCRALLRYQGQADVLVNSYGHGAESVHELALDPAFRQLDIYEPGVLGPFRSVFADLLGYVVSAFWPDAAPGELRDGMRCENLMALTFRSESFDLVITSDVFEHVRHPLVGFRELHRVLRPGGRHIWSIPVQSPMRPTTIPRVDTSGMEDEFLLEPRYHNGHLVYNDFGANLMGALDDIGFETETVQFRAPSIEASRLLTFNSLKR